MCLTIVTDWYSHIKTAHLVTTVSSSTGLLIAGNSRISHELALASRGVRTEGKAGFVASYIMLRQFGISYGTSQGTMGRENAKVKFALWSRY